MRAKSEAMAIGTSERRQNVTRHLPIPKNRPRRPVFLSPRQWACRWGCQKEWRCVKEENTPQRTAKLVGRMPARLRRSASFLQDNARTSGVTAQPTAANSQLVATSRASTERRERVTATQQRRRLR